MKYIILAILLSVNTSQAQTLDEYLWPNKDKPSIFFQKLVEYVNVSCEKYKKFPTEDIATMCQLQKILDLRSKVLNKIAKSKLVLPSGREWEALFLGVVTKDYDFSGSEITYNDVADFLVNQMALRKAIEATNRVFLIWHPYEYFSEVVYPAHLSSIEGSSLFIYQIRYIRESQCNINTTNCPPFYNDLNSELLGHLKFQADIALKEVKTTSNWVGIESYLMTRATFRHFLQDLYAETNSIMIDDLMISEHMHPSVSSIKTKIVQKLEDLNKFDLGYNESLVNAIFALAQLTEMDEILTQMSVVARPISEESLHRPEVAKYAKPVEAMIAEIKTFVTGL